MSHPLARMHCYLNEVLSMVSLKSLSDLQGTITLYAAFLPNSKFTEESGPKAHTFKAAWQRYPFVPGSEATGEGGDPVANIPSVKVSSCSEFHSVDAF